MVCAGTHWHPLEEIDLTVFYDAGALFYITPLIQRFFKEVWQTPNQLLKAVSADLSVREYVAGCKALGIIK